MHYQRLVCQHLQKDEFLRLVINSVRNDLISRNEAFQCLALDFVANGRFLSQELVQAQSIGVLELLQLLAGCKDALRDGIAAYVLLHGCAQLSVLVLACSGRHRVCAAIDD